MIRIPTTCGNVDSRGADASSGLHTCKLEVREGAGEWHTLSSDCTGETAHGEPGHLYTFRLTASDNVSNTRTVEAQAALSRVTKYYYHGGQRVAMRQGGVVYYLHGDHLGSTSLATNESGGVHSRQLYYPYGEVRYTDGTLPTDRTYTGQMDVGMGLMHYGARFYDPYLNRFISADTIVPGAAASAGGGLGTIGYNEQMRLTPLTVGFHETQFLGIVNAENRELLQFGPPALWDGQTRQEHNVPMGPANPQALNRYAYCVNNPLRYVDPTGYYMVDYVDVELTAYEAGLLLDEIAWWLEQIDRAENIDYAASVSGFFIEALGILGFVSPEVVAVAPTVLAPEITIHLGLLGIVGGFGVNCTEDDLTTLHAALDKASNEGTQGVRLTAGRDLTRWGVEINGEEVLGHTELGTVLPVFSLFSPRGSFNGTLPGLVVWSLWLRAPH